MKTFSNYISEATAPINFRAVRAGFEKVLKKFETKEGTPGEIAKAVRSLSKKYLFEVLVKKTPELKSGDISVWAYYEPESDREWVEESGTTLPIGLILLFSTEDKKLALTKGGVEYFARYLSESLAHEWLHLKQARARNWKNVKTKEQYLYKVDNIEVGSYLAKDDEIEAHAFNIAGSILDLVGTKDKAIRFLKSPRAGALSDHHFDLYIKIFGKNHTVTKRLYKKIITYLDR